MNQGSKTNWLVIGGIGVVLILVALGYRISSVSFNLGPVSVDMEKPTEVSLPQNEPFQSEQATQPSSDQQQPFAPQADVDFNPPLSLPFSDGFDNGISPEWRVVSGSQLITNGRLSGADSVMIQVGNNTLSNYVVEFNVYGMPDFCTWGYNNYLIVSVTPTLQYRADYTDLSGRGIWYANQNGSWNEIARDEIGVGCEGRVSIVVNGNSYSIYANGSLASQITYGNSTGAPFGIGTSKYPQIDDITIREP